MSPASPQWIQAALRALLKVCKIVETPCESCRGSGQVFETRGPGFPSASPVQLMPLLCPICLGAGASFRAAKP